MPALVVVLASGSQTLAGADEKFRSTEFPLPRFVSLRSEKVYARTGPGLRYPVRWTYMRDGLPVEVVKEFDAWRKIRDIDGEEGWVHRSLVSGNRTALVIEDRTVPMQRQASAHSPVIARIEPRAVLNLHTCEQDWCLLEAQGFKGWVQRKSLWGIYQEEDFN